MLDKMFPPPAPDQRLPLVAHLAADIVAQLGCAEITGVPGDQQAALRAQIRQLVRRRTGHPTRTYYINDTLHVVCRPVMHEHAAEYLHAAMQTVSAALLDEQCEPLTRDWVINWDTWFAHNG